MSGYRVVYDVLTEPDPPPPPTGLGWWLLMVLLGAMAVTGLIFGALGYWAGMSLGGHKLDLICLGGCAFVVALNVVVLVAASGDEFELQRRKREWVRSGAVQMVEGPVEISKARPVGHTMMVNAISMQGVVLRVAGVRFCIYADRWPELVQGIIVRVMYHRVTCHQNEILKIEVKE